MRLKIRSLLAAQSNPLTAISCLAAGADQIFAEEALRCGASLTAVVPANDYENTMGDAVDNYETLQARATCIVQLEYEHATKQAYMAAGRWVVDHCDVLVAVWDGQPAAGSGGTGDIVAYADSIDRQIILVWPQNVVRN